MLSLASLLGMHVVPDLILPLLWLWTVCSMSFSLCMCVYVFSCVCMYVCVCVSVCVSLWCFQIFTFLLGIPASPQPVSPTSQSLRPPLHKGTSDLEAPLAANMSNINFWLSKLKLDANALGHPTLNMTFLTKFCCKTFNFVNFWATSTLEISSSFVGSRKTSVERTAPSQCLSRWVQWLCVQALSDWIITVM